MGGKKKKGKGGKKKGASDLLKQFAESPEEFMIKENLNEKILYEWLRVNLQALEEDNNEVHTQYHTMLRDFKEEEKNDQERIKEYGKEIGDLLKEQDERKLQNENLDKEIADLAEAHRSEIKDIEGKNAKEIN